MVPFRALCKEWPIWYFLTKCMWLLLLAGRGETQRSDISCFVLTSAMPADYEHGTCGRAVHRQAICVFESTEIGRLSTGRYLVGRQQVFAGRSWVNFAYHQTGDKLLRGMTACVYSCQISFATGYFIQSLSAEIGPILVLSIHIS